MLLMVFQLLFIEVLSTHYSVYYSKVKLCVFLVTMELAKPPRFLCLLDFCLPHLEFYLLITFKFTTQDAVIEGYSITNSIDEIRQRIGVCLQQDLLYDSLTAEQHLILFGTLKGVNPAEINTKVFFPKILQFIVVGERNA